MNISQFSKKKIVFCKLGSKGLIFWNFFHFQKWHPRKTTLHGASKSSAGPAGTISPRPSFRAFMTPVRRFLSAAAGLCRNHKSFSAFAPLKVFQGFSQDISPCSYWPVLAASSLKPLCWYYWRTHSPASPNGTSWAAYLKELLDHLIPPKLTWSPIFKAE